MFIHQFQYPSPEAKVTAEGRKTQKEKVKKQKSSQRQTKMELVQSVAFLHNWYTACGRQVDKKESALQIATICALTVDCEIEFLDPRPKLLGFHMSGPVTCP
jgi:hypothetical protein